MVIVLTPANEWGYGLRKQSYILRSSLYFMTLQLVREILWVRTSCEQHKNMSSINTFKATPLSFIKYIIQKFILTKQQFIE
jgi:hypothetical protein